MRLKPPPPPKKKERKILAMILLQNLKRFLTVDESTDWQDIKDTIDVFII